MASSIRGYPVAVVVLSCIAACHRAPEPDPLAAQPQRGQSIGDTTAFGPRLLDYNVLGARLTYELAAPAYVILLNVVAGGGIEPVMGFAARDEVTPAGSHAAQIALARPLNPAPREWNSLDYRDHQQCVDNSRRRLPKRRVVRTDSSGKTVSTPTNEVEDRSLEREAERRCERFINQRSRPLTRTPQATERYLLLIASNVYLSQQELIERLNALTITARDARSTLAAIPEGLFVDRPAIWSGHWMRW